MWGRKKGTSKVEEEKKDSPPEETEGEGKKETLEEERDRWKNLYYEAYADTQNLRKSLEEDHRQAVRYRSQGFLEKLIPSLDCLYIALQGECQGDEARNYREGFRFIYRQLEEALLSEGVSYVEPKKGDLFDPRLMEAIETVEGQGEPGHVVRLLSKGYLLHDRLVRAARVVVEAARKEAPAEEGKKEENAPAEGSKAEEA